MEHRHGGRSNDEGERGRRGSSKACPRPAGLSRISVPFRTSLSRADKSARNEIAYLNYVSSNGNNASTSVAARKDRHDLNSGDERE